MMAQFAAGRRRCKGLREERPARSRDGRHWRPRRLVSGKNWKAPRPATGRCSLV